MTDITNPVRLIEKLRRVDNPAFEQAVGLALLFENTELTEHLANALLDRLSENCIGYLIKSYHKLPPKVRDKVSNQIVNYSATLRSLSRDENYQTKKNVIQVIQDSKNPKLAYILALMLTDDNSHIRNLATQTFEGLASCLAELIFEKDEPKDNPHNAIETREDSKSFADQIRQDLPEQLDGLLSAIEIALDSFPTHLRTEIIQTAMIFGTLLPDRIMARFQSFSPRDKISRAAVEILTKRTDPRFAGFVFRMLKNSEIGKIYTKFIIETRNEAFIKRLLRYSWLRFDPEVKKQLMRIKHLDWIKNNYEMLVNLSSDQKISFVNFIVQTALPAEEKLASIKVLLASNDPAVHSVAITALGTISTPEAIYLLEKIPKLASDIEFPPHIVKLADNVKNIAVQLKEAIDGTKTAYYADLKREPTLGRKYFELVWNSLDRLKASDWEKVVKRLQQLDYSFNRHLQEKLNSEDEKDKTRALLVVRRGKLINEYLTTVCNLCKDKSPKVRSAAILTVAESRNPAVESIIVEALDDPDSRVQANAVEALEIINPPDLLERLESKLSSPNNRIRANAIKAILKPQFIAALQALSSMLNHPEPLFRRSALWVIKQISPQMMTAHIEKLAENDPEEEVRLMAKETLKMLKGKDEDQGPEDRKDSELSSDPNQDKEDKKGLIEIQAAVGGEQ